MNALEITKLFRQLGVQMNLKTHSVYSEVTIDEHNIFTIKLLNGGGVVKFEDMGAGKDRADARKRIAAIIEKEEPKYVKGKV